MKNNLKSLLLKSNTLLIANYYYARFWKSVVLLMISNMFELADRKINKAVAKNLLENLVLLYIRVRSHSYAKKLKEFHKHQKKASRKR